jgi:hypothetical protein
VTHFRASRQNFAILTRIKTALGHFFFKPGENYILTGARRLVFHLSRFSLTFMKKIKSILLFLLLLGVPLVQLSVADDCDKCKDDPTADGCGGGDGGGPEGPTESMPEDVFAD